MFRRSRNRIRPTTEAGTSRRAFERCQFTFGIDHEIGPNANASYDLVAVISGQAMIEPMSIAGTQAAAVARMLQNMQKGYDVLAIQYHVHSVLSPGQLSENAFIASPFNSDIANTTVMLTHDLITQVVDTTGSPVSASVSLDSQWPVNQSIAPTSATEDADYALRTHFHDTRLVSPHIIEAESGFTLPGRPYCEWSVRSRIRRRIGEKVGLYLQFGNLGGLGTLNGSTVFHRVSGSLWYRTSW